LFHELYYTLKHTVWAERKIFMLNLVERKINTGFDMILTVHRR